MNVYAAQDAILIEETGAIAAWITVRHVAAESLEDAKKKLPPAGRVVRSDMTLETYRALNSGLVNPFAPVTPPSPA